MQDILTRLDAIEHQLNFYKEAYTQLHNAIIKGTYIRINEGPFRDAYCDLKTAIEEFKGLKQEVRNDSILGTMAFIAKQIHEMQKTLDLMQKEGIKKQIKLDFVLDGYEMVKKKSEERCVENETPEDITERLLESLDQRERQSIIHRYGLYGSEPKTFNQIGALFGVTSSRARDIYNKAIRKCRHPSRKNLVRYITHIELKKDITGD